MAKIWFSARTQSQSTVRDVSEVARVARVADLANENGWNFEGPDPDVSVNDYRIDVPDKCVPGVLSDLIDNGIAPGTIDFRDGTSQADTEAAVTVVFTHELYDEEG